MALEDPKPFNKQRFIQAKHLKAGDTLKGHLVGDHTGGKYQKRDIVFQASEPFSVLLSPEKDAAPVLTTIEKGERYVVPLSGTISKFWTELDANGEPLARLGTLYHVVYDGKSVIKKGQWKGSEAHVFRILRDMDNTITVTEESDNVPF